MDGLVRNWEKARNTTAVMEPKMRTSTSVTPRFIVPQIPQPRIPGGRRPEPGLRPAGQTESGNWKPLSYSAARGALRNRGGRRRIGFNEFQGARMRAGPPGD